MPTAKFRPDGGALTVAVSCEPNRNGSYTLRLWKAGENTVIQRWEGNFLNPADDNYALVLPCTEHNGRIIEVLAVVANPPGSDPAELALTVSQDGEVLATDGDVVPPGTPGQMVNKYITMELA